MAPKIVSEHERVLTRQAIINQTKKLIAVKQGIKNITVDDIVNTVGMGKGSFYSYFSSKETCIYEVIYQAYATDLIQLEAIMEMNIPLADKIKKFVDEIFLGASGIDRYIAPKDYEILLRKLPPEYTQKDELAAEVTMNTMMQLMGLGRLQVESFMVLLDCISNVVTQEDISDMVKKESINALTKAIASYIKDNSQQFHVVETSHF